jgi:hypothetical protein
MEPLYAAVRHGCCAGSHQEVLDDIYVRRIQRGTEFFGKHILGAFGADLAALSAFFEKPWSRLVGGIATKDKGFLLNEAAYDLRALGRMREASQSFGAAWQAHLAVTELPNAAENAVKNAGELAHTLLTMGQIAEAIEQATESKRLAGKVDDPELLMYTCAGLAHALHQAGRLVTLHPSARFSEISAI